VKVEGLKLVRADNGQAWQGRGANLPDLRGCNACTYQPRELAMIAWKKRADALFGLWGANFARLNLTSVGDLENRRHGLSVTVDPQYLDEIEEMVRYIGETHPHVQLLVNLFSDPSFAEGRWEPTQASIRCWELIASRLVKYPHVWFGLTNEIPDGVNKVELRANYERMISVIRAAELEANAPSHIITVQGHGGWARCFDDYVARPFSDPQVVYERHVYESTQAFSVRERWSTRTPVPEMAAEVPTIIGEFGPDLGMTLPDCGALVQLCEQLGLSYLGWTFHMRCGDGCNMFEDHSQWGCGDNMALIPTPWGQLVMDAIADGRK
jgi:hypothetical protein